MKSGEFLRLTGRALKTSYRARGAASTAVSVAGFALALLPTLISMALRDFTDAVQGVYTGDVELGFAFALLAALVALYIGKQLYDAVRSYFVSADTERIMRYIKEVILRTTCDVKMKYIDNSDDFAEKVAFADSHAGLQVAGSMQEVASQLQNLVAFAGLALVMAGVNPWIIPVVVITCLPSVVLAYRQERETYALNKSWARRNAFIQMYYQDCTRFQCLQETRFLRILPYIRDKKWRRSVDEYVAANNALVMRHTVVNCAADVFRGSVYLAVLVLVAARIYEDPAIGLGAFTLAVSAAGQMQTLVSQMFFGTAQFVAHVSYMKDFFDLEQLEREPRRAEGSRGDAWRPSAEEQPADPSRPAGVLQGRRSADPLQVAETSQSRQPAGPSQSADFAKVQRPADIRFDHVTFSYPGSAAPVLKDVSVTVREGEKVAIVGRNGSGKSTFVNLLCGLYEPQEGSVSIAGNEVSADPRAARESLSAVFQNFGRYEDTIRFNVVISDARRASDDGEIMSLLEKAGAADFVRARSRGLDEVIGSYAEGGNNLSGGQWQRIAIARAAYRSGARIMLLDEPTSALDPMAEATIYRNFADLVGGRTALLISHRLGIAAVVDRVLVFDDGRIVEDGSPDELLAAGGLYAKLYESQAQWYRR